MPDETPEQRDERVTAENEKARLARQDELGETEYRNALRVHGLDVEADADNRVFGQLSTDGGDDTEPMTAEVPATGDKTAGE
jgi:hypothetical protein